MAACEFSSSFFLWTVLVGDRMGYFLFFVA